MENIINTEICQTNNLLTISDVSTMLNFSIRQIRRWIASDMIPVTRFGSAIRFVREDIEKIKLNGLANNSCILKTDHTVTRIARRRKRKAIWDT